MKILKSVKRLLKTISMQNNNKERIKK